MTSYGSTVTTLDVQARVTIPEPPGGSGSAQEGALAYAYHWLGRGDEWRDSYMGADTAMTYSAVWGCVRVIAQSLASVAWNVFEKRADDPRYKAPIEDDVVWTLNMQASPEVNAFDWRQVMLKDALLGGNAYAEIERSRGGRFLWLHRLDPGRVEPERDEGGRLWYAIDNGPGVSVTYLPPEAIFHLKGLGPDGLVGWSVVKLARRSIQLGLAEEKYGVSTFGKSPMPGGIVSIPGNLSNEQRQEFRRTFEQAYTGGANAGRVIVLSNGITFNPATLPNDDQQFLESRKFQVTEICRWFGVPPHKLADLDRATFCLPAGQTVLTESGPQPVEAITPGVMVWSRGEAGMQLAPVVRAGCAGDDPILMIRTTNRTLRCNARHPILCRRKTLAPLPAGVNIGGAVTPEGVFSVGWETRYVPAGGLGVGDTVVTLDHLPDAGSLEACPTRLPTIGFMEFCGLLLGDGNLIRSDRHGSAYVTIARARHAAYMDYYREVIVAEFRGRGERPVHIHEAERQTRFSSVQAVEELATLGFSGTARTKRVPGWVFRLPETHRLAFVRGFLDADGSCDKMGRLSFSSCNGVMLGQVRDLCIGCGVPVTNLRLQEGTTTLPTGARKDFAQYSFTCSDPGANRRVGSRTPAYVARMEAGQPFGRKGRAYPWHGGKGFEEPGLSLARISSVEIGPAEPVYDLTVEGTHSFVAEGVVVHNSNIEEQEIAFVRDCLLPWSRRLENEADVKCYGPVTRGRKFTRLNLDALMRGNSAAQTSMVTTQVNNALMTINEGREYLDRNPIEGGDTPLVQGAMAPLERILEPPPPPPAPAPPPVPEEESGGESEDEMSNGEVAHA